MEAGILMLNSIVALLIIFMGRRDDIRRQARPRPAGSAASTRTKPTPHAQRKATPETAAPRTYAR